MLLLYDKIHHIFDNTFSTFFRPFFSSSLVLFWLYNFHRANVCNFEFCAFSICIMKFLSCVRYVRCCVCFLYSIYGIFEQKKVSFPVLVLVIYFYMPSNGDCVFVWIFQIAMWFLLLLLVKLFLILFILSL